MLGRLVLLLLQIVIGWFGSQAIMKYIQMGGIFRLFIFAIVAAIVVFLVGIIAVVLTSLAKMLENRVLKWRPPVSV